MASFNVIRDWEFLREGISCGIQLATHGSCTVLMPAEQVKSWNLPKEFLLVVGDGRAVGEMEAVSVTHRHATYWAVEFRLVKLYDELHNAECNGWHPTLMGERHCRSCNPQKLNPQGPPPWHEGDWLVDGIKWKAATDGG